MRITERDCIVQALLAIEAIGDGRRFWTSDEKVRANVAQWAEKSRAVLCSTYREAKLVGAYYVDRPYCPETDRDGYRLAQFTPNGTDSCGARDIGEHVYPSAQSFWQVMRVIRDLGMR